MISLYLANPTWLHRCPAGAKLGALAICSLALLPVEDWRLLLAACACTALTYTTLGRGGSARLFALRIMLPLVLGLGAFQWMLVSWQAALGSVLRIMLMIMLADLVTLTTPMQDMMRVITPLLSPFKLLGLNVRKFSLAVTLVIRFVPVLLAQWQGQSEAWRARSPRKPGLRLMIPFLSETLRRADHVAEGLEARQQSSGHSTHSARSARAHPT
jgi:biotin transport system permease protein